MANDDDLHDLQTMNDALAEAEAAFARYERMHGGPGDARPRDRPTAAACRNWRRQR